MDRQWRTANPRRHLSDERLTMVCYARPASRMAALLLVVFLVFGRSAGHFLDSAALFVGIAVAVAVAAVAAAVAFTMFLSVRRRRAAAGGCVSCQLRCQHAMTEQPRRLLLVSTVDRSAAGSGSRGSDGPATAAGPVGAATPRWPDRPAIRSGAASRPVVARPAASRPAALSPVTSQPVVAPRPVVGSACRRPGADGLGGFTRLSSGARAGGPRPRRGWALARGAPRRAGRPAPRPDPWRP